MICSLDCEVNPKCTSCKIQNLHSRGTQATFEEKLKLYKTLDGSVDIFLENIDKHIPRID